MNRSTMGLLTLATLLLFGVGLTTSWVMYGTDRNEADVVVAGTTTFTLSVAPPLTDPTPPTETAPGTTLEPVTTGTDPPTTVTDPTTTFTAPVTLTVAEQFVTDATNDLRIDLALPTLSVNATLDAYAGDWAMHMAVAGAVSHSNIEVLLNGWTVIGENVVASTTAESAFDALVASPSHYEIIADPAFTEIGVGVVLDEDGTVWIVQVFAGELLPTTTTLPEVTVPTIPVTTDTLPEVTLPSLP